MIEAQGQQEEEGDGEDEAALAQQTGERREQRLADLPRHWMEVVQGRRCAGSEPLAIGRREGR